MNKMRAIHMGGRVVSIVFHPLLAVCYAVALLMGYDAMLGSLAFRTRAWLLLLVAVDTVIVPLLIVQLMRLVGAIPGGTMRQRRGTLLGLSAAVIGYAVCLWMLSGVPMAFLTGKVVASAMWCALAALTLSFFRVRVSSPMLAAGAFCSLVVLLIVGGYDRMIFPLCGALVVAGLLGSLGLYAGRYNLAQTCWSFVGGAFVVQVVLLFF